MVMGEIQVGLGRCDSCQEVYGSSKGGVSSIRKVCQLMERCDGHWGM